MPITGTLQLNRSQWQWIDVYCEDSGRNYVTSLTTTDMQVRYKKNNATTLTVKKLLTNVVTTIASGISAGATSVTLTDASVFPLALGGSVKINRGGGTEEIVTFSGTPGLNTVTISATTFAHSSGEDVELVDFLEVGNGIYTILFSDSELDTVGQFTILVNPLVPGTFIQVLREADILYYDDVETLSAATAETCLLTGRLLGQNQQPLANVGVSARPLALPEVLDGYGIGEEPVSTSTDVNGYFELEVIQGSTLDISIPGISYRRTVVIPAQDTANLFTLASS